MLNEGKLSAVVVSPNTPYRVALVKLLQRPGMVVEAAGASAADVMESATALQPAIVFVEGHSLESIAQIKAVWPDTFVLYLLDYLKDWEDAMASGADVCVLKEQGASTIIDTISFVAARLCP